MLQRTLASRAVERDVANGNYLPTGEVPWEYVYIRNCRI